MAIELKDSTGIFNIWKMAQKYNCDDFHNMLKHKLIAEQDEEYMEGMASAYFCIACGAINEEECCCEHNEELIG